MVGWELSDIHDIHFTNCCTMLWGRHFADKVIGEEEHCLSVPANSSLLCRELMSYDSRLTHTCMHMIMKDYEGNHSRGEVRWSGLLTGP